MPVLSQGAERLFISKWVFPHPARGPSEPLRNHELICVCLLLLRDETRARTARPCPAQCARSEVEADVLEKLWVRVLFSCDDIIPD